MTQLESLKLGRELRAVRLSERTGPGELWCGKCERAWPEEEFARDRSRASGRDGYCKACRMGMKLSRKKRVYLWLYKGERFTPGLEGISPTTRKELQTLTERGNEVFVSDGELVWRFGLWAEPWGSFDKWDERFFGKYEPL